MSRFVLDASLALAWFVDKPVPALALRVRRSLENDAGALVPAYFHLEVANGLLVGERRGEIGPQDSDQCIVYLEQLMLSVIEVHTDAVPASRAIEMARTYRLTPYDAIYLSLAHREGIALATLDHKLRIAAIDAGVEVIR